MQSLVDEHVERVAVWRLDELLKEAVQWLAEVKETGGCYCVAFNVVFRVGFNVLDDFASGGFICLEWFLRAVLF